MSGRVSRKVFTRKRIVPRCSAGLLRNRLPRSGSPWTVTGMMPEKSWYKDPPPAVVTREGEKCPRSSRSPSVRTCRSVPPDSMFGSRYVIFAGIPRYPYAPCGISYHWDVRIATGTPDRTAAPREELDTSGIRKLLKWTREAIGGPTATAKATTGRGAGKQQTHRQYRQNGHRASKGLANARCPGTLE